MFAKSMHLTLYSDNFISGRAREPSLQMRMKTAFRLARVPRHTSPRIGDWPGGNGKGLKTIDRNFLSPWPLCLTDLASTVPSLLILLLGTRSSRHGSQGMALMETISGETPGAIFASDRYIKRLGFDPEKTIRMSKILDFEHLLQMVIPPGLTNAKGGGLALRVECHDTVEGFEKGGTPEVTIGIGRISRANRRSLNAGTYSDYSDSNIFVAISNLQLNRQKSRSILQSHQSRSSREIRMLFFNASCAVYVTPEFLSLLYISRLLQ